MLKIVKTSIAIAAASVLFTGNAHADINAALQNICTIVKTNDKKQARLESMRYVLSQFDYKGKGDSGIPLLPDPNIIMRYHRSAIQIDI